MAFAYCLKVIFSHPSFGSAERGIWKTSFSGVSRAALSMTVGTSRLPYSGLVLNVEAMECAGRSDAIARLEVLYQYVMAYRNCDA